MNEKKIGDFTLRVEQRPGLNGPFAVRVYGCPGVRTLACRFQTEKEAAEYLRKVNSRDLMECKF